LSDPVPGNSVIRFL